MLRSILLISLMFLLSASAYSETKRELREKLNDLENSNLLLKVRADSLQSLSDSLSMHIKNLENQIEALLFEVPCLDFSKDVEGEYLATHVVIDARNEQTALSRASDIAKAELSSRLEYLLSPIFKVESIRIPRIAKLECVRECVKIRENSDKTVTAYVVYHLPIKVTIDRIVESMRSYTEKERENFRKQAYKKLGIK